MMRASLSDRDEKGAIGSERERREKERKIKERKRREREKKKREKEKKKREKEKREKREKEERENERERERSFGSNFKHSRAPSPSISQGKLVRSPPL
jgi:hypothetical protein